MIDSANAPVIGVDTSLKVQLWNHKTELITGYLASDAVGKNLIETYIHPDHRESVRSVLLKSLEGEDTPNYEFPLYTADERRLDILLSATARRD